MSRLQQTTIGVLDERWELNWKKSTQPKVKVTVTGDEIIANKKIICDNVDMMDELKKLQEKVAVMEEKIFTLWEGPGTRQYLIKNKIGLEYYFQSEEYKENKKIIMDRFRFKISNTGPTGSVHDSPVVLTGQEYNKENSSNTGPTGSVHDPPVVLTEEEYSSNTGPTGSTDDPPVVRKCKCGIVLTGQFLECDQCKKFWDKWQKPSKC